MKPFCYALSFSLLLFTACESEEQNKPTKERVDLKAALEKEIKQLKRERDELTQLTEQSLQQIQVLEKKRSLSERAEQIRIKADEVELSNLYASRLKKINQQQRFTWEGYHDKSYQNLVTRTGKTYTSVIILGVNHDGFNFQHSNGVSRISFSQLSKTIEDKCITQFDQQVAELKAYITSETEERLYIREQAKLEAEAEFK